jgi:hypothetical protein
MPEEPHEVSVRQEKSVDKAKGRARINLTEEAFWELLKKQVPKDYDAIRALIDEYQEKERISIEPTEGSIVVKLDVQDTGQQVSLFFVRKNANLCTWPQSIKKGLEKAGLNPSLANSYENGMRLILKTDKKWTKFSCAISRVNLEEFKASVDAFIDKI